MYIYDFINCLVVFIYAFICYNICLNLFLCICLLLSKVKMNKNCDISKVIVKCKSLKHENNIYSTKYKYYDDRIVTFDTWPKAHPVKSHKLCASGFIYTGKSDRVICFCCKLIINCLNSNDNPFIEHQKLSSNCEYIKMVLPKIKTTL